MLKKKTKKDFFLALLFFALIVFYGWYHIKVSISSDTTTTFPMSMDITKGNFLLKGWVLGTNNFFFTEIVPYALGILMGGTSDVLINWIPGIAYAILLVGTILLLKYDDNFAKISISTKVALLVAIISFLGVFPYSAAYTLLNANSHNNLYAFLVIYLLFVFSYLSGRKKCILWATLLSICMSVSESVTSMVLFAPMGCFCILFFIQTRDKVYGKLLFSVISGFAASKIIIWCIEQAGGFYTRGLPVGLVRIYDLPSRILAWWREITVLLGLPSIKLINVTDWCYYVILFLLCVWVLISLIYYTLNIFNMSWVESVFYFISVINIVACIITNVAVFHRYLVPGWYFGIMLSFLLLIRLCDKVCRHVKGTIWIIGIVICLLVVGIRWTEVKAVPCFGAEQKKIVAMLKEKGYEAGYGSFWCASQISFFSDYVIPIYPVRINNSLQIQPYEELIRKNWYQEQDKHFVIIQNGTDGFVNRDLLLDILGKPQDSFKTENYEAFYWAEDISHYLINQY